MAGYIFCFCFLFFNDCCQTNYVNVYQIFGVGITMAVDDQSEVSFSVPQGTLPWQPTFVGFDRRRRLAQLGGLTFGFAVRLVLFCEDCRGKTGRSGRKPSR